MSDEGHPSSASGPESTFDLLDRVRARPHMFVRQGRLEELEAMLWGFEYALLTRGIVNPLPSMMQSGFSQWLRLKYRWSLSAGWAYAIQAHAAPGQSSIDLFFELFAQYRELSKTVELELTLSPHHQPSDEMDRPEKVQVLRYRPEPLHIIRLFYPHRIEETCVSGPNAEEATKLRDAIDWLTRRLGIQEQDFED
ncbi:hypothetical protein ABI59_06770 [Acidobacteria bacterium Mor1]|nr:hypothetical protein ABI59_06770 [Acidobacteria bacterium Mor1]